MNTVESYYREFFSGSRGERGFTLVEIVVSMVISAILVTAVFAFFQSQTNSYTESRMISELQQETRWASEFIADHMKYAGNGVPPTSGWKAIENVNGASGAPDSVIVLGAFKSVTGVTNQAMANTRSLVSLVSAADFEIGDLAVISDGTFTEIFKITNIAGNNLAHDTAQPWNDDDQLDHTYGTGSTVSVIEQYTFYLATDAQGHPNLMVKTQSLPPQLLAGDIEGFQVRFLMKSGQWADTAEYVYDIRQIEVTMRARSPQQIPHYRDPAYGDGYKRLELKTLVIPKNLVII